MKGDFLILDWIVEPQINTIRKDGDQWHVEPKIMQVLMFLVEHRGQVCSKEKLIEYVWHETFVSDDALIRCISEIRRVFGDDPRTPHVVQTIHKVGYRLIGNVQFLEEPASGLAAPVAGAALESATPVSHAVAPDAIIEALPQAQVKELGASLEAMSPDMHVVHRHRIAWHRDVMGMLAALLLVAVGVGLFMYFRPSPFQQFWKGMIASGESVILCMPDQSQYGSIALRDAANPSRQTVLPDKLTAIVIDDVEPMMTTAFAIREMGGSVTVRGQDAVTLSDLRSSPGVFIGAFDNPWTLRLTAPLRYHFMNNASMTEFGIVDSTNHATQWIIHREQQMATNSYRDYALLASFRDSMTGRPALVIAGLGRGGTIAGGEFLSTPSSLTAILNTMNIKGKANFEVVLSTQIVDGHPGSSKIEAVHFW